MRIGVMLRAIDEKFGVGMFTRNLTAAILRQDDRNEYVLFYRRPEHLGQFAGLAHVRERVVPAPCKLAWDQVAIPRAARAERLEVLLHTKFTVPLAAPCPTAMIAHGASWFVRPELYSRSDVLAIRATMPLYCRRAAAILANSELTRADYIRLLGVPAAKVHTVLGAPDPRFQRIEDPQVLESVRRRYGLAARFFLTVGRYDPRKNVATLFRAYTRLREAHRTSLVIVGQGSERYRSELDIQAAGFGADVIFPGYVDQADLPAIYSLARAFLFPSVYEEFGIPLCEAMACGCPIVAANTGAIPEITAGAALLIDPFDDAQMAAAIDRLTGDPALASSLARAGLRRARDFSWDKSARRTLAVLAALGGERPAFTERRAPSAERRSEAA
jgi:glycosyltransferase involved in cell wall biosynthesis